MKRFAALFGVFVLGAAAQDPAQAQAQDKLKQLIAEELQTQLKTAVFRVEGGVMGKQVTGAPYSAVEVRESTQVLADGTRIHNENSTTVYRDGEGRMRRETPNEITIFDPVGGFSYTLNPKTLTARKMPMNVGVNGGGGGRGGRGAVLVGNPANAIYTTTTSANGNTQVVTSTATLDPAQMDKLKAEKLGVAFQAGQAEGALQAAAGQMMKLKAGNREDLGQQVIEGVASQGTRNTVTFDANSIGNDRSFQVVNETWLSPDLQTTVMTRHNDPRSGEETFRLTNIRRGEPGADLFQPPANYQIVAPTAFPAMKIVPDK